MCQCTPEIRTPFCGKPNCKYPDERVKEFTEHDMRDAFQAGMNYIHNRIERNIKYTILNLRDSDFHTVSLDMQTEKELFSNILKDKRGQLRI